MDAAVGKITEQVMGILFKFIGRHIGYIVYYKKHIKNLEDEAERLEEVKLRIRGMVDEASSNAEVLDRGVERWLEEVQQRQDEVGELLEGKEKVTCMSVGSCYRLGRRGCKKKEDVIGLKERGVAFDRASVARPAPLTDIWYTHAADYQRFDSRDSAFKEIMDALQDDSKYIIGIHGMPGVGKTRMADEVAKQAKEDKLFEEAAKATVSQTLDWEAIQRELAECLNLQLEKETRAGRAGQLCNRLKNGKKILLIMDDVWNPINLKEIGIPFGDQTKGCKILLTSRREDVCIQMGVEKVFRLRVLREDEAWSLLKKKVGDSIDTPEMQLLAKEVCKECGGLPLAILAVGGALMNTDRRVWNDALQQLRNCRGNYIDGIEAEVYTPIELSYKYLKQADAQSCFLHCSLFREDAEISIDDLLRYGVGTRFLGSINKMEEARDRVHALVSTLKRSSLLLQGRNENFVKMHDIIRDVAISIASKDEQYAFLVKNSAQRWLDNDKYECCIAISLRSNAICELPDELECPKLRTLVLVHEMLRYNDPLLKVPNNFFKGMEKLEVLHLTRLHILTLKSSLQNLVNVRMVSLTDCKLVSLSLFNELHKLEILSLKNCSIEESPSLITDYDIVEPAIEAGRFIRLRILDLSSTEVRVIPSGFISNLSRLEELYIYGFDGWEVEGNVSSLELNYLAGLSCLEIHLQDVMLLPKDLHFESLNRFKISIGCRFDYSDYEYNSSISRALKLKGIPLKVELNVLMERAQALSFIEINGLEKLLHNTDFPDLEYLKVDRCNGMEDLLGKAKQNSQTSSTALDKLSVLKVSNCMVKYLFFGSNAKGLQQLQRLHVQNCDRMEAIIGERDTEQAMDTIIFNQLKNLELKHLPKLKSICANMKQVSSTEFNTSTSTTLPLFNEKVSFPALEELNIKRLESITEILAKQSLRIWTEASQAQSCSFNKLSELTVSNNCKLKYLFSPSIVRFLQNQLRELKIKGCESMEAIIGDDEEEVTDNIIFHQLEDLELLNLPNLKSIYANKKMSSIECSPSTITSPFFDEKVSFPALETLSIERLDGIPVICEKQSMPIRMEESHAKLCSFSKLSVLTVNGNCELKYLFSPSIATLLQRLKQLHVEECKYMETLIGEDEEEFMGDIIFCQLKRLELVDLPNLKSIFSNKRKMSSPSTTAPPLFNAKVWFPSLETLVINELDMITVLWEMRLAPSQTETSQDLLCSFRKLSDLTVSRNCKLKYLFSHSMARCLGQLHKLNVEHCESMEAIIGDDKVEIMDTIIFSELKSLKLDYLPNLKCIYANMKKMSSTACNPSTPATTFFNAEVSFPLLEVLSINSLDSITRFGAIISNQQLQELTIISCEKIEELIAIESGDKGEEVIDDEILTFTQLRKIKLDKLPNLQRLFFSCDSENKEKNEIDGHHSRGFFSNKVSFPALEFLFIKEIDCITRLELLISFQKLQELTLTSCEKIQEIVAVEIRQIGKEALADEILVFTQLERVKLENLPNLKRCLGCSLMQQEKRENDTTHTESLFNYKVSFPVLKKLNIYGLKCILAINRLCLVNEARDSFPQELHVKNCENLEMIVAVEMEAQGGEANENVMVLFPQLKNIRLEDLPNVKSFCSTSSASKNQETMEKALFKFNHNVKAPPHLEVLYIKGADNLKEIWHDTVSTDSFSKLTELTVRECGKLLNIGPLRLLRSVVHNLKELEIIKCPLLQDVFKIEASNAAEEDERIEEDEGVRANLESSVAFRGLKRLSLSSFDSLGPFSKGKDSFPMLEKVEVSDGSMFEDIWEGRVPEGFFLDKVRVLRLKECSQLVNVPGVLQRFEAVEELTLTSCSSLQVVFNLHGLDATERLATTSSQVKELALEELPKLEHVWLMEPKRPVGFSNLTWLSIECCNNLRYLFSLSIARALTELKQLYIENCDAMEEIVMIKNEEHEEANVADEIVFPRLEDMWLEILPKLRSFCEANNAFQFPSLDYVVIRGCPKLYTFTCGATRVLKNKVSVRCDDTNLTSVRDINEYVRQYVQKMKKLPQDNHRQQ